MIEDRGTGRTTELLKKAITECYSDRNKLVVYVIFHPREEPHIKSLIRNLTLNSPPPNLKIMPCNEHLPERLMGFGGKVYLDHQANDKMPHRIRTRIIPMRCQIIVQ